MLLCSFASICIVSTLGALASFHKNFLEQLSHIVHTTFDVRLHLEFRTKTADEKAQYNERREFSNLLSRKSVMVKQIPAKCASRLSSYS